MNNPTPIAPVAESETKSDSSRIAVAILWWPDQFNDPAHIILQNALQAALRRHSIETGDRMAYYRNHYSVGVFKVSNDLKGKAILVLEETLEALALKEQSSIASLTADGVWLTIRGIGQGGIKFEDVFLNPEEMEKAEQEASERLKKNLEKLDWVKQNLSEILKNPNFGK